MAARAAKLDLLPPSYFAGIGRILRQIAGFDFTGRLANLSLPVAGGDRRWRPGDGARAQPGPGRGDRRRGGGARQRRPRPGGRGAALAGGGLPRVPRAGRRRPRPAAGDAGPSFVLESAAESQARSDSSSSEDAMTPNEPAHRAGERARLRQCLALAGLFHAAQRAQLRRPHADRQPGADADPGSRPQQDPDRLSGGFRLRLLLQPGRPFPGGGRRPLAAHSAGRHRGRLVERDDRAFRGRPQFRAAGAAADLRRGRARRP